MAGLRIETGTKEVFSEWPGGEMWNGHGTTPRSRSIDVAFDPPFHTPPVVTLSLSEIDAGNQDNLRVRTKVSNLTHRGFSIVVETWEGSKLASVGVTYLAIGE